MLSAERVHAVNSFGVEASLPKHTTAHCKNKRRKPKACANFTLYFQNNKSHQVNRPTLELYFSQEISEIVQNPLQNPLDKNPEPMQKMGLPQVSPVLRDLGIECLIPSS